MSAGGEHLKDEVNVQLPKFEALANRRKGSRQQVIVAGGIAGLISRYSSFCWGLSDDMAKGTQLLHCSIGHRQDTSAASNAISRPLEAPPQRTTTRDQSNSKRRRDQSMKRPTQLHLHLQLMLRRDSGVAIFQQSCSTLRMVPLNLQLIAPSPRSWLRHLYLLRLHRSFLVLVPARRLLRLRIPWISYEPALPHKAPLEYTDICPMPLLT